MEIRAKTKRSVHRKATTADVISNFTPRGEVDPKWKRHYQRLMDLREVLLARRNGLMETAREEMPPKTLEHMAEAGTDNYDRDFALSMISSEQNALFEIEQALDRINKGIYGFCEVTGKPIETPRLNAIPWTRFSADAERELEKRGEVDSTRLAPPERLPKANTENSVGENHN